jgi:hypothetical protein
MEIREFIKRSYAKDCIFEIVHYDIEYVFDALNGIFDVSPR